MVNGARHRIGPVVFLVLIAVILATAPLAVAQNPNPGVVPVNARAHGKSYGEWSAVWWQWASAIPASENPILDTTGANCASGQSGQVWFLAGASSSGSFVRTCTVPPGKNLFFPIANSELDNFICVEPDTNFTVQELRDIIRGWMDGATGLSASIDGVPITSLAQYRVTSPVFNITIPSNYYGTPLGCTGDRAGTFGPAVADGIYLLLPPLSAGLHTIRFAAAFPAFGFGFDLTYNLTVAR